MSNGGKYIFVYDKNYAQNVTTNFQTFLENDLYIDLIFVCRNNKRVGAHQVVLGCLSKFFYSIFVDNLNTLKEKVLHIHVPDIRAKIMKYILQFIYSGKAMLNKEELEEFNEDIKLLGMPLDHFSAPSEAAENIEIPTAPNPPRKSTPRVVADTVDLTDISINDDVMEVKGKSDNTNELPSRETPAEATIPALPTVSADSNNTVTPPLIDKNPTEKVPSAISSETENRTTSTSSSSSNATTKLPSISAPENRTTSTSSSNTSTVATSNPKSSESVYRTPTISSCSSTMTMVPENKRNIVKPETTVPQVPENNTKKPPHVDLKRQRSKNAPPPSKRTRYLSASIDLDASDDDDVITLS